MILSAVMTLNYYTAFCENTVDTIQIMCMCYHVLNVYRSTFYAAV